GPRGARVTELSGGVVLVTLTGREGATEHVVRAARCALRLHDALPGARIALVMGHGHADSEMLVGPAVERAAALLDAGAESREVRVDDVAQALLDARFDVRPVD